MTICENRINDDVLDLFPGVEMGFFIYFDIQMSDFDLGKVGSRSRRYYFTKCEIKSIMSLTVFYC